MLLNILIHSFQSGMKAVSHDGTVVSENGSTYGRTAQGTSKNSAQQHNRQQQSTDKGNVFYHTSTSTH